VSGTEKGTEKGFGEINQEYILIEGVVS